MKSVEDLDRWIGTKVKGWSARLGGVSAAPEVLEIHRDILEDISAQLEPKGQGRYFFPHNHILIYLGAADASQESRFRAAFADCAASGELALAEEVRALLAEAGAPASKLMVDLQIAVDPGLAWTGQHLRIKYDDSTPASPATPAAPHQRPPAKLVVIRGQADMAEYSIAVDRVNIGRLKEVLSEHHGLRRLNDIAFSEAELTVSREHAFLTYDPQTGRFRVCDEQSQRGTIIFRSGRRIEVPKGSRRGTQLRAGDEIHLGDARLRFEIENPDA